MVYRSVNHGITSSPLPFGASISRDRASEDAPALAALYAPAVVVVTLGAFALRLVMLDRFPFREDEAAYAYWALHGWFEDPMFLAVWPDKPPVYLWLLGGAFRLFGVSEASARWVNVAASTLAVPITVASARKLWGRRAALVAGAVLALSPYAISFGSTAYTDPVLVLAGMSALCAALYGRPLAAGLLLGATVMTKQQGILFAPLVIGALALATPSPLPGGRRTARLYGLAVAGAALIVVPILYWDSLRWAVAPSPWDLGVRNYATVVLLAPQAWPARAALWASLLFELTASWATWTLLAALVAVGVPAARRECARTGADRRRNLAVLLIAGWSLVFLASHVFTTVQPWDRYLLPLAPMLALLAAWGASRVCTMMSRTQTMMLAVAGVLILVSPGLQAADGQLPLGGDHGDYTGLPDAIRAVENSSDEPFVLYHRELGAHYRFYLNEHTRDQTRQQPVELRWFPTTVYLADNAAKTPYPRKFLIVPDWASLGNLDPHLAMRGLKLMRLGRYGRFTVWEIRGEAAPFCNWCMSRQPASWPVMPGVFTDATLVLP